MHSYFITLSTVSLKLSRCLPTTSHPGGMTLPSSYYSTPSLFVVPPPTKHQDETKLLRTSRSRARHLRSPTTLARVNEAPGKSPDFSSSPSQRKVCYNGAPRENPYGRCPGGPRVRKGNDVRRPQPHGPVRGEFPDKAEERNGLACDSCTFVSLVLFLPLSFSL